MKRLIIATIALFILAGVTYFTLGQKPEVSPEVLKKIKLVSRFKDTLPQAEAGNVDAQYRVAIMYREGDGTAKDHQETVNWLEKAAAQGHAPSRYELGMMYTQGDAVRQDFFTAAKFFRLAATFNKYPPAQYRLAELYFNGRGVEHDYAQAIKYYRMAAENGHAAAQFFLGAMYQEGWGIDRDLIQAYVWLTRSAQKREESLAMNPKYDPVRKLESLVKKMNNFQIEKAKRLLAAQK